MIIGAQKSGTTSLLRYLGEHPDVVVHPQKEFAYYVYPEEYNNSFSNAFKIHFGNENQTMGKKILAKSAGLYVNEAALKQLKKEFPEVKLVFILRQPVDRTYSSFLWEKNEGDEKRTLESVFGKSDFSKEDYSYYIEYSLYAKHLKIIYSIFPKEQVKIIFYEDFKKDAVKICSTLFKYFNISDYAPEVSKIHNQTTIKKSESASIIIKKILNKKSWARKVLKPFVTPQRAAVMGEKLRMVNSSKLSYPELPIEIRNNINALIKSDYNELITLIESRLPDWKI